MVRFIVMVLPPKRSPVRLPRLARRIADLFLGSVGSNDAEAQDLRRLYVLIGSFVAAWGVAFGVAYVVNGFPVLLWLPVILSSLGGFGVLAALRTRTFVDLAGWMSGLLLVCFFSLILHYGGVRSAAVAWPVALPVMALSMGNWGAAKQSFYVVSVVMVLAWGIESAGALPEVVVPPDMHRAIVVANMLLLSGFLLGLGRIGFLALRDRSERLEAVNRALERTQRQLVDAARYAGRAEVATGALHNVGNALNGVSVSTARSRELLRAQKVGRVADLAALLEGNPEVDARVVSFAKLLAADLARGQEAVMEELGHALGAVEHVVGVIAVQQEDARHGGLVESVDLVEAVDAARRLVGELPAKVEVKGPVSAKVETDRHRLLQVLANILKNAAEAVADRKDGRIDVVVEADVDGAAVIVRDNGVGIAEDDLERIFAHGFTTKARGTGFGLHASALAAREIGGMLTVRSDGPGHGACFRLTVPFRRDRTSAAR